MSETLPPLPEPALVDVEVVHTVGDYRFYTADQMRSYAAAAVAAERVENERLRAALREIAEADMTTKGFQMMAWIALEK